MPSLGDCPARPTHPGRPMDDSDGQVSWLAGQCLGLRRLLRIVETPMAYGAKARRSQLQGQPGYRTPFPFDPR